MLAMLAMLAAMGVGFATFQNYQSQSAKKFVRTARDMDLKAIVRTLENNFSCTRSLPSLPVRCQDYYSKGSIRIRSHFGRNLSRMGDWTIRANCPRKSGGGPSNQIKFYATRAGRDPLTRKNYRDLPANTRGLDVDPQLVSCKAFFSPGTANPFVRVWVTGEHEKRTIVRRYDDSGLGVPLTEVAEFYGLNGNKTLKDIAPGAAFNWSRALGIRCKQENGWLMGACTGSLSRGNADAYISTAPAGTAHPDTKPRWSIGDNMPNLCLTDDHFDTSSSAGGAELSVFCIREF